MTDWKDGYVEAVMKGMNDLADRLFPKELDEAFRIKAEADIAAGKNKCAATGQETMLCIYPEGIWICKDHADSLWRTGGIPGGRIAFDMHKPQEGP